MPESSYERARRYSTLNQDTGKYEHRDENWVMPEGHASCLTCGSIHPEEDIKHETYYDLRSETAKSGHYCPTCSGSHYPQF